MLSQREKMYNKVVVPLDGLKESEYVLSQVANMALKGLLKSKN
jgi:hypothetical protein